MRTIPIDDTCTNMDELLAHFIKHHGCKRFFDDLQRYATGRVVEFGVFQGGTTAALLNCPIETLTSYDIDTSRCPVELFNKCNTRNIPWTLERRDSINDGSIEPCDMLILDTMHTYEHVRDELSALGGSVRRFIAVHDTKYPPDHKNPSKRVGDAVKEFAERAAWKVVVENTVSSGHMIIEKC